jgi:hypothetical protein
MRGAFFTSATQIDWAASVLIASLRYHRFSSSVVK